jgi:uncharacterized peroxidase-related enzyme
MAPTYKVANLPILSITSASGKARSFLESAKQQLGFAPNMYGAMVNEPALYESYATTYRLFRAECGFTPIEQEVIFLAISRENNCRYCLAAHSFVADKMSKVPTEITDAIRDGRPIGDAKLRALADFVKIMVETRGRPSDAEARKFMSAGYSERNILGVILAIGVKTLSNYTNHIFDTPIDDVFASRIREPA